MIWSFGRVLRTGLSSLRDRAAARLAALRFNPSRDHLLRASGVFLQSHGKADHEVTVLFSRHEDAAAYYAFLNRGSQ